MTLVIPIPGREPFALTDLVLDVNGTLTDGGALLEGVEDRIACLRRDLEITVSSADTFGSVAELAQRLGVTSVIVMSGAEKAELVDRIGAEGCVAIGNGANDAVMLERAALGIAVLGPEGASSKALVSADVICRSAVDALDLLLDPKRLVATLRL